MTKYRVDRNKSKYFAPVGMNSILYVGDNFRLAQQVFRAAIPHKDAWNQDNVLYGVTLSVWNPDKQDWVVKMSKGFNLEELA